MRLLLAKSSTDNVKVKVAQERVKQAKLKAERDYLRSVLLFGGRREEIHAVRQMEVGVNIPC